MADQPDPQLKKHKTQQRFYFPLVRKSDQSAISLYHVNHLYPFFVDRPKNYPFTLQGFPIFRKEPTESSLPINKGSIHRFSDHLSLPSRSTGLQIERETLYTRHNKKNNLFVFSITISLFLHGILFLICIYEALVVYKNPYGNTREGQPIDVVFLPQTTGKSGLQGAGYNGEPPPPHPIQAPPPSALPSTVTETTPPVPPLPSVHSEQEIIAPKNDLGPIPEKSIQHPDRPTPTNANHERQYTYHSNKPLRFHTVPRKAAKSSRPTHTTRSRSPFESMTNLDFNENPNTSRRKLSKIPSQGSRSAINMSTGPLVKNGQINVPYASNNINIKGVNADYGNEVAAWIYRHMYYPSDAIQNGEDGSPSVHVVVNRDGQVLSIRLTHSSGSDTLDAAITGMFRDARLPKIPPELPDHFDMDLQINYILIRQ